MKIWIGRDFNESLRDRRGARAYAQRLLWFVEDDDILVLSHDPDPGFLEYVCDLTGTRAETVRVLVPAGEGHLTADRLLDPDLLARVRTTIGGRTVDLITSLWPDAAVAAFASAVGAADALAGHGFFEQGGDVLASSKAVFRIMAGGNGVPTAPGAVCASRTEAVAALERLLDGGLPVMLKHEFASGGWGNEIVTRGAAVTPVGAHRMTMLAGALAVRHYLDERWDALTDGGRHYLVMERYVPDSRTVWAEYTIDDGGARLGAVGGLVPTLFGVASQVIPALGLSGPEREALLAGGEAICSALRGLGYRGVMSGDAIVTPDGQVLFTEANCRITGSTHSYRIIGTKVVGAGFGRDRVLVERAAVSRWNGPARHADLVEFLHRHGLAYNPRDRRGVVLVVPMDPRLQSLPYVVVDSTPADASVIEAKLADALGFEAPGQVTP